MSTERFETIIIGGGQAGLSAAYHLAKRGRPSLILDANERIGDSWRNRWDSLRVFTPARYNGLPSMPFPARGWSFPTKDEIGDYFESYAKRFGLATRTGVRVDALTHKDGRFVVDAGGKRLDSENVIVATGACQVPRIPGFALDLEPGIVQLHSSEYRNPRQLRDGPVLIVGAGNSGAEIAYEVGRHRRTMISGKPTGEIPVRHGGKGARVMLPVVRFMGTHVLTTRTPVGRKVRPFFQSHGAPLIRIKMKDLEAAGVERVARTVGARDGKPELQDGRIVEAGNVIWCTGFRYDFSWIDLPVLDGDGEPRHVRGVVEDAPGLYFMGLVFQFAAASDVLPGVGRDAEHIAKHIAARARDAARAPVPV